MHISEQLQEIEDSINYLGQRPVECLLNHVDLSDRFHMMHATHLTPKEATSLGVSKATIVLCLSTEGNLGDEIFSLLTFQNAGGQWNIGTDSHIGINPLEELRLLDYGQRLMSHLRNTSYSAKQNDSGTFAIQMALHSGRKAMNNYSADFF